MHLLSVLLCSLQCVCAYTCKLQRLLNIGMKKKRSLLANIIQTNRLSSCND